MGVLRHRMRERLLSAGEGSWIEDDPAYPIDPLTRG